MTLFDALTLFALIEIGLLCAVLLRGRGRRGGAGARLALLLLAIAASLPANTRSLGDAGPLGALRAPSAAAILAIGPALLAYVRAAMGRPFALRPVHWAPLAAGLGLALALVAGLGIPPVVLSLAAGARLLHALAYIAGSLALLGRPGATAPGVAGQGDLRRLRAILAGFLAAFLALVAAGSASLAAGEAGLAAAGEAAAVAAVFLFVAALTLDWLRRAGPPDAGPAGGKYAGSGLGAGESAEAYARARAAMEGRELYLDGGLSLASLAAAIGLPEYRMSQVINQNAGLGFPDFVNSFRVERAKRLMAGAGAGDKLLAIALDAGFNSKSAFNAAFRKACGTSPSAYRAALRTGRSAEDRGDPLRGADEVEGGVDDQRGPGAPRPLRDPGQGDGAR